MISNIINEFITNSSFYLNLLKEHIVITFTAVMIAIVIGLGIGIWISQKPKLAGYFIAIVNIVYTIPSIALLGFLISWTGIGNTTAIIALTIYALLPIVRSTYIGITTIDANIIEASRAMGSKEYQILYKIKLPLAFPIIFSSIMNMVTMTIALAGIASFVGAGGLGVAIYRGITTNNELLILNGSILIALLALVVDGLLSYIGKLVSSHKLKKVSYRNSLLIFSMAILVIVSSVFLYSNKKIETVELASKPTSEGYVLAELVAELIENDTNLKVNITHGVGGGTSNIHPALLKGEFDMYPEYTGTAWQVILKKEEPYTKERFEQLNQAYQHDYHLLWKGMFGFNNTYSIGIRADLAMQYHIKTFSDLAKYSDQFIFGAEYDFFEREDGYKALTGAYNYHFKKAVDMDNGLKYQALFDKKIDAMTVFTTDGQLSDSRIVVLEDDLNFYPKYLAGMVVSESILNKHPELDKEFDKLSGILDEKTMAELNYRVEIGKENPKDVAKQFLQEKGLLEGQHG
ncbi:ABC transporter permease subunit [Aerococcaceae bacterium zg-ZUI334]|uniref:ABC transporter permease/substrate-binding protein n=1 Tax=Aerococcaceae bacterium zg-252 TaxID=2796928 RepID=UPI001B9FF098|nr:ABC transporter permease subunit [Aerococcaceae bacterium zg-ZUI334]